MHFFLLTPFFVKTINRYQLHLLQAQMSFEGVKTTPSGLNLMVALEAENLRSCHSQSSFLWKGKRRLIENYVKIVKDVKTHSNPKGKKERRYTQKDKKRTKTPMNQLSIHFLNPGDMWFQRSAFVYRQADSCMGNFLATFRQ